MTSRFSCCLSAYRHSLLGSSAARPGVGPSSRSAYRTNDFASGPGRDYHVPHARATTGIGCLLYPEGGGAHPAGKKSPAGACRSATASPYTPLGQPISEAHDNETSTQVHAIHPPGLALTCNPRMERRPSGLNPELRTPPLPATHVRAGTGHRAQARNYATDQPVLLPASSLAACDLVSQLLLGIDRDHRILRA